MRAVVGREALIQETVGTLMSIWTRPSGKLIPCITDAEGPTAVECSLLLSAINDGRQDAATDLH